MSNAQEECLVRNIVKTPTFHELGRKSCKNSNFSPLGSQADSSVLEDTLPLVHIQSLLLIIRILLCFPWNEPFNLCAILKMSNNVFSVILKGNLLFGMSTCLFSRVWSKNFFHCCLPSIMTLKKGDL